MVQVIGAPDITRQLEPLLRGLGSLGESIGRQTLDAQLKKRLLDQGFTAEETQSIISTDPQNRKNTIAEINQARKFEAFNSLLGGPDEDFPLGEETSRNVQITENLKKGQDPFAGSEEVDALREDDLNPKASRFGLTYTDGSEVSSQFDRVIEEGSKELSQIANKRDKLDAEISKLESVPFSKEREDLIARKMKERDRLEDRFEKAKEGNALDQKKFASIQEGAEKGEKLMRMAPRMRELIAKASAQEGTDVATMTKRFFRNMLISKGLTTPEQEELRALQNQLVVTTVNPLPRLEKEFQAIQRTQPDIFQTAAANMALMDANEEAARIAIEKENFVQQLRDRNVDPKKIPGLADAMVKEREDDLIKRFKDNIKSLPEEKGISDDEVRGFFQ